jgi:hypothetical protein
VELTSQRTALLAVLGLGALALVADRIFSGPGEAQGAGPARATESPSRPAAPPSSSAEVAPGQPPLLHRMQQLPEAANIDQTSRLDAFKAPRDWLPATEPAHEPVVDVRAEKFRSGHRLTAVLTGPAGNFAVIGGVPFAIGQEVDGFILIAVDRRSATFSNDELEVVLSLPEPMTGRRSPGRN